MIYNQYISNVLKSKLNKEFKGEFKYRSTFTNNKAWRMKQRGLILKKLLDTEKVVMIPDEVEMYEDVFGNPLSEPNICHVEVINCDLFKNNKEITDIILPTTLWSIPEGCFEGCTNLKALFLPKRIRSIGPNTFKGVENLDVIFYEGTEEEFKKINVYYELKKVIHKLGLYDEIETYYHQENQAFYKAKKVFNCKLNDEIINNQEEIENGK